MAKFKWILIGLFSVFINSKSQSNNPKIKEWFETGNAYFKDDNPTDLSDSLASVYFGKLLTQQCNTSQDAYFFLKANENLGVLSQLNNKISLAKNQYKNAIDLGTKFKLADTLVFNSLVYLSALHFQSFEYDSCYLYLEKAEKIVSKYPNLEESERLFNSFGALYFESGNFRQSIHYFKKALSLRNAEADSYSFSFKNNIASALQLLHEPDSSLIIYQQLYKEYPKETVLKINLASVYLDLKKTDKAKETLKSIDIEDFPEHKIDYLILKGRIDFAENKLVSAKNNFELAMAEFTSPSEKKTTLGIVHRYLAELAFNQHKFEEAMRFSQLSMINQDIEFKSFKISDNPQNFSQGFHSFQLFKSLLLKSKIALNIFKENSNIENLAILENSQLSLKNLIKVMSNSQNQETARMDLKLEIQPYLQAYTDEMLLKFYATKDSKYLNLAFENAEETRATVLALSINEDFIKQHSDLPDSLLQRERLLNLSILSIKKQLQKTQGNKNALEQKLSEVHVELARLNDHLDAYPGYRTLKYLDSKPFNIKDLQNALTINQVFLSYHEGQATQGYFVLNGSTLSFNRIEDFGFFKNEVSLLKKSLMHSEISNSFDGKKHAQNIYNVVFNNLKKSWGNDIEILSANEGIMSTIPLESLQDKYGKFAIEQFAISYVYSSRFILNANIQQEFTAEKVLALAPFNEPDTQLYLPKSEWEIDQIEGAVKLKGQSATKSNFMQKMGAYQFLHLATHAKTDNKNAENSYLQFYENDKDSRFYMYEFRPGILKNTDFAFLSSCESFGTKESAAEGVMGLSRAFYLAGCEVIVSSLWTAEDRCTAYISGRFYHYLKKGFSYSKALQSAKIDFLSNSDFIQFHDPRFWSHLVCIGYQFPPKDHFLILQCMLGLSLSIFIFYIFRKKIYRPKF